MKPGSVIKFSCHFIDGDTGAVKYRGFAACREDKSNEDIKALVMEWVDRRLEQWKGGAGDGI